MITCNYLLEGGIEGEIMRRSEVSATTQKCPSTQDTTNVLLFWYNATGFFGHLTRSHLVASLQSSGIEIKNPAAVRTTNALNKATF